MNRTALICALALAPSLRAQDPAVTPSPTPAAAIQSAQHAQGASPEPTPFRLDRPISSHMADVLSSSMPKYAPPTPTPAPAAEVDARDIDKPRNEIKRLPKYVVRAPAPPVFREQDLYSKNSLGSLGMTRYAGLNLGPLSLFNQSVGQQLVEDDERQKNIADLKDTASLIGRGDKKESEFILKETDSTYLRSSDWTPPAPNH